MIPGIKSERKLTTENKIVQKSLKNTKGGKISKSYKTHQKFSSLKNKNVIFNYFKCENGVNESKTGGDTTDKENTERKCDQKGQGQEKRNFGRKKDILPLKKKGRHNNNELFFEEPWLTVIGDGDSEL